MEKETKKYFIIGAVLVVTVAIGVVLWKKYQTETATNQGATEQSNQDELAILASSLASNAYAGQAGGAQPFSTAASGTVPQSLADEVLALEKALGFAPDTPATTPAPTAPTAPVTGAPTTPAPTGAPTPEPVPPHVGQHPASEMIKYHHGMPIFEMDGVAHEGVIVT